MVRVKKTQEQFEFKPINIEFPFCFSDKKRKNFYRFLEDGRYEIISIEDFRCNIFFGTYQDTILRIHKDINFYLQIAQNHNTIITNEDFESTKQLAFVYHEQYIKGEKYIGEEVLQLIKQQPHFPEPFKSKLDDIIINKGEDEF